MTMAAIEDTRAITACARPQKVSLIVTGVLKALVQWQKERATLRALEAMPEGMRKDFGWPAPESAANAPCPTAIERY